MRLNVGAIRPTVPLGNSALELRRDGTFPFCNPSAPFTARVDSALFPLDTPCMARPDAARRVKSYSAASGFVYQYYFFEVLPARRTGKEGREYTYMVSADRSEERRVGKECRSRWSP